MSYLKFMKARRKSGETPTMKARIWNKTQKDRIEEGVCVHCAEKPADKNSYLCSDCQSKETMDDIRQEIKAAREKATHGKSIPH